MSEPKISVKPTGAAKRAAKSFNLFKNRLDWITRNPIPTVEEIKERKRQEQSEKAAATRKRNQEKKQQLELVLDIINSGYKAEAIKRHPDKGGTNEAMHGLPECRDRLIALVDRYYLDGTIYKWK